MRADQWPEHWAPPHEKPPRGSRMVHGADGTWWESDRQYLDEYRGTLKTAAMRARQAPPPAWDGRGLGARLGARPTAPLPRRRRTTGNW